MVSLLVYKWLHPIKHDISLWFNSVYLKVISLHLSNFSKSEATTSKEVKKGDGNSKFIAVIEL